MKKLMIAACAVALAAAVQAASCDWGVAGKSVQNKAGEDYKGVRYCLVNTSAASWDKTAVIAALTDGTLTAAAPGHRRCRR